MTDTKELFNNVKAIMSTQLTETEVLVYLLMEGGYSDYKVADLPLGIARSTAGRLYKSAKVKMDAMAEAGIFTTELK
jgi:hypothetical protein